MKEVQDQDKVFKNEVYHAMISEDAEACAHNQKQKNVTDLQDSFSRLFNADSIDHINTYGFSLI